MLRWKFQQCSNKCKERGLNSIAVTIKSIIERCILELYSEAWEELCKNTGIWVYSCLIQQCEKSQGYTTGWFRSYVIVQSLSCVWLFWDSMDYSTWKPGFLVLHHLLEFAQTHIHWVCDTNHRSHPLSYPSPAFKAS